ncbi:MAG: UDP-N-acetylmuramyl-tripeptide synthetase [Vicinamibacterales bacterium]
MPGLYARMRRRLAGMLVIGVTGTKGKTSTTEFIAQLLDARGLRTAVSTTESARIGSRYYEGFWSVPELDRFVALATRAGVDAVVIELCSSALRWDLHTAFNLDVAVLTNIGTDHIPSHGNRRGYMATKQRMFRDLGTGTMRTPPLAVLNEDDASCAAFAACLPSGVELVTYGVERRPPASGRVRARRLHARHIADGRGGVSFVVEGDARPSRRCRTALHGRFNVANVLAAIGCVHALGHDWSAVVADAARLVPPPGRFHIVGAPTRTAPGVVVDYAHTPESLEAAIEAAAAIARTGRVHVAFGCGGDTYKAKRPQMGRIAAAGASRVVITSDNPRFEAPDAIVRDILRGVPRDARGRVSIELDRARAIDDVVAAASPGDCVLVAGKGAERTQEVAGRVIPFSDLRLAQRALDARLGLYAPDGPRLSSIAAVVADVGAATPRYARHADLQRAPASLAKLMTLYLAAEAASRGDSTLATRVAISRYAATTPHARLRGAAGDRVPVRTLLLALGVHSSNLAATALAEHVAGNEAAFITRMNDTAARLGLRHTRFATPHGLPHPHQHTTAADMARLLQALLRDHPAAVECLRVPSFTYRGAPVRASVPRRAVPGQVLAIKTGFTWESGDNLAVATRVGGRLRTVVVLGAPSRAAALADVRLLLAW